MHPLSQSRHTRVYLFVLLLLLGLGTTTHASSFEKNDEYKDDYKEEYKEEEKEEKRYIGNKKESKKNLPPFFAATQPPIVPFSLKNTGATSQQPQSLPIYTWPAPLPKQVPNALKEKGKHFYTHLLNTAIPTQGLPKKQQAPTITHTLLRKHPKLIQVMAEELRTNTTLRV